MLVTHLSIPQVEDITTETTYQEDKEAGNYKQNFNVKSSNKTADPLSGRSIPHPLMTLRSILNQSLLQISQKAVKNLKLKKNVLKARVPFERNLI